MAWLQKLERKSGVRWRVYWRDPAGRPHGKIFERRRDADEERAPACPEVLDRPAARARDALQLRIRVDRVRQPDRFEQRQVILGI